MGRVDLKNLTSLLTESRRLVVNLNPSAENPLLSDEFATPRGLALEKWAVEFVDKTKETQPLLGAPSHVKFRITSMQANGPLWNHCYLKTRIKLSRSGVWQVPEKQLHSRNSIAD